MPRDERRLERHRCTGMLWNQSRRIVGYRTSRRNSHGVTEAASGADQVFSAGRGLPRRGVTIFGLSVELHAHLIWTEFAEKDLYLENVLPVFFFYCRAAKTQA